MKESTDTELWTLCLQGDSRAFEAIYKRFYPMLYAYGVKLVSDGELVRDTIQNLFVKLIQNHRSLSATDQVKGYLLRAFRNKLLDALDSEKIMDDIAGYEEAFSADSLFHTLFTKDDEDTIREQRLMQAYRQLSRRQQEILYLYYISELKLKDITAALNINYQSGKNLLFRSLTKLRELYKGEIK